MSGAYHRRRDSPARRRRGSGRPRGRRARPAHLRSGLPGRPAARLDADGQRRGGAGARRRSARATSRSTAGSTPRTSSRTTPTARSSCAGRASSSARARSWTTFDEHTQAVPFAVARGPRRDRASTARPSTTGLVVTIRESAGTAADMPDRVPAGTAPTTPVRLRVEQVSSVEHAIVLGVPRRRRRRRGAADRPASAGRWS